MIPLDLPEGLGRLLAEMVMLLTGKKHERKSRDMQQQSTSVNVEERFGQLVEEASGLLEEHGRWCAERVRAAEETAQADVARFEEASEQLPRESRRLADLEEERERLPLAAYTANMEGDAARESEFRQRYASIPPEHLEALRRTCSELEAKKNALGGTSHGAEKQAREKARDEYASVLTDLEAYEGRIGQLQEAASAIRTAIGDGQRQAEEHLRFLREIERDERREARREDARREEASSASKAASFPRTR